MSFSFVSVRPPARNGSAPLAQPGAARGEAERSGGPALRAFGPQREPQPRADCGRGKGHSNADGDEGGPGPGSPSSQSQPEPSPARGKEQQSRPSRADPTARTSSDLQVIFFSLSFLFVCLMGRAKPSCRHGRSARGVGATAVKHCPPPPALGYRS